MLLPIGQGLSKPRHSAQNPPPPDFECYRDVSTVSANDRNAGSKRLGEAQFPGLTFQS